MKSKVESYFDIFGKLANKIKITDRNLNKFELDQAIQLFMDKAKIAHSTGNKLMFIGNGGSSTIASHMAEDYSKAGNIRSIAFNDSAFITCLGNDFGYEHIFSKQIEMFSQSGDILIAISSSGNSLNIVNAIYEARKKGCWILTLTGFNSDNAVRKIGDINIYVPSEEYGLVEISHLALCHSALDINLGWGSNKNSNNKTNIRIAAA